MTISTPTRSTHLAVLAVLSLAASVEAQPLYTVRKLPNSGPGIVTFHEIFGADIGPQLFIQTTNSCTVIVETTREVRVNSITLEANNPSGSGINVTYLRVIPVTASSGRWVEIGYLGGLDSDGIPNGQLVLDQVRVVKASDGTGGVVGSSPNWPGWAMRAGNFIDVQVEGMISGLVESTNAIAGRLETGRLLGTLRAMNGPIGTIVVNGEIGDVATNQKTTIETLLPGAQITSISAKSIFADIRTVAAYANGGDIWSVQGTGTGPGEGFIKGSITTRSMGQSVSLSAPCLSSAGPLEAVVSTSGAFRQPISVASIASTGKIAIGVADDTNVPDLIANSDINVAGAIAGSIDVEGNKIGSLRMYSGGLTGTIHIKGDVIGDILTSGGVAPSGDILIDDEISSTGLLRVVYGPMAGKITVGKSLLGNIEVPADGLVGQVIVNASNTGGEWSGVVNVGSVVLSSPTYDKGSSALGGGAIGLAPFHLYETDCVPPHDEIAPTEGILQSEFTSSNPYPIRVRFYGPLKPRPADSWDDCLAVEVLDTNPLSPQCSWMTVTTGFRYQGPGDPGWTDARSIGIGSLPDIADPDTPVRPMAGVYRVRVASGTRVRCDQVDGNPDVVWPLSCTGVYSEAPAYVFRIVEDCPNSQQGVPDITEIENGRNQVPPVELDADNDGHIDACESITGCIDFDHNGIISIDDLFMGTNFYFTGDPRADMNGSGGVTIDDYFLMINAYFTNNYGVCP